MPLSPLLHRLLPRSATGACVRRFAAALSLLLLPLHAPAQSPATRAALMSSASPGSLTHGSPEVQRLLTDACRSGSHTAAEQALALGASANDKDSPLTLAAERNDLGLVELLIQYGADASREPAALPAALRHKNAALASSLLNAGADPNLPDAKGATPLSAALTSGDMELARLMFRHGGYPDEFIEPAMQHGDLALLTALFQYGILPDRTDQSGNPLLVRAALDNKPEIAAFLLQAGADQKKTGKEGLTALQIAAIAKEEPLLRTLLDGGCDPNQVFAHPVKKEALERIDDADFKKWLQRDTGLTPLMLAAARGDTPTVALLVEKGARRGLQTRGWQRYPVVFACDGGHVAAAKILLGRKHDPEEAVHRVTISLSRQRAVLYKNDEPIRNCRVSTGRKGYGTPTGRYVITDKQRNWVSTIYHVAMPYFMRLNCLEIGMHAGNCPGYPASHGCIRMPDSDVRYLFGVLQIGDAVTIEE